MNTTVFQQVADRCSQDEVQDRLHEACISFGIPPSLDPDVLSSRLRPVLPRKLRELVLSDDHFKSDAGFSSRTFNDILAHILVISDSSGLLKDSRNPMWCYDVQCNPDHARYVGPTSMTKL